LLLLSLLQVPLSPLQPGLLALLLTVCPQIPQYWLDELLLSVPHEPLMQLRSNPD
jgi:hypothetical protein